MYELVSMSFVCDWFRKDLDTSLKPNAFFFFSFCYRMGFFLKGYSDFINRIHNQIPQDYLRWKKRLQVYNN